MELKTYVNKGCEGCSLPLLVSTIPPKNLHTFHCAAHCSGISRYRSLQGRIRGRVGKNTYDLIIISFFRIFFFFVNLFYFIHFIFGCIGSLLLCVGFLYLRRAGATLRCGVWASHCGGVSC